MSFCKYLISVIFTISWFHYAWPSCVFHDGKYDLSALGWPDGWTASSPRMNGSVTRYDINICSALNYTKSSVTGCPNSSVCQIIGNTSISFGDVMVNNSDYAIADNVGNGFTLFLLTKSRCGSNGIYRSAINFACGPNLGSPEVLLTTKCQVNFYWKTSAACAAKPKMNQVPCYVIDEQGEKHDLSHLIKPTGGYVVSTRNPAIDLVINVCSNILLDNQTEGCPADSSACRIAGSEKLSFGVPHEGLQSTKEGLLVTYKAIETRSLIPAGCSLAPKTTILFKCPDRGYSQPPKVISDLNCQYEVEWETEYTCPESMLKANVKSCQFSMENHGIEIDLSPLSQKPVYIVPSSFSNTTSFAFKVCGGLDNFICGSKSWKSISVCMIDQNNPRSSQVVGMNSGNTLIYADDQVTLTYPKGSACEDGMEHSTVIKFMCDPNANQSGDGEPRHISSEHCVHFFEWATKHACLKHSLDTPCFVTVDKKKISLQKLYLTDGEAWEAVDRRMVSNPENAEYYINVCGQVSGLGNLTKCGPSSSACVLRPDGNYLNLGNFTSPPVYDPASNSLRLEYTGGSPCRNDTFWRSTIDFVCRPGQINSEPVLSRIDEDGCLYEFEWQTAEACPEGIIEGSDCKVFDSNLGIDYDLNPLRSKTYKVDTEMNEFYVGVCEPISDSPCSKNPNSTGNVGVCQVNKSQQRSWKTGEPSSHLSYADGVVNLTYLSGDPYNDPNNTARMTIIIFICDYKAGNGSPYFVEEVDFAYVFHWYTNLVCPKSISTECLAHDPDSHLIYDLSGFSVSNENWVSFVTEDDKERKIYLNVCRSLTRPSICDSSAAACVVETTEEGEKVVVSNIGRATSGPVIESPGHISLTYTQGNPCVSFGRNTTYSTVIHFLCVDQMSKNGPMFLNKLGACEYAFLWATKAACPTVNLLAKESCELTDPVSGFTFDLTPLRLGKRPYSVQGPSGIIQFDVCGKIIEGCTARDGKPAPSENVSVCEVDTDGIMMSEIASANSYALSYSVGQDLTLTYKSDSNSTGSYKQEVVIKFPCYNRTVDPKPKFIRHEGNRYSLEMPTRLTCIPSHFDCTMLDNKGNEYDLNVLTKFTAVNWEVGDFKPERSHLRYHINFCRPLIKVNSYKCPGGASAACQTSTLEKNSSGHDLGSQMSTPTVTDKGTILIRYTNGSFCPNIQFRRSTTIELFCSQVQGDLTFLGETPECEYLFSLDTPAACPLRSNRGSGCMVKDPVFGYTFDLNPLKSKNNNYNITVGEYTYSFNVCDKLNGFDKMCGNSSACQTKPGTPEFSKSLGLPSNDLVYRKGIITLNYESGTGSCHGKYNRSTKISFICHHGHEDKDGPTFVSEAEDCSYLFEWPTVHACPPFDVTECSVVDENGITYDFSKLSLPNDNYYVKNPFSENSTFVINLCRSVVHTPNSLCDYTSAVCLVDNDLNVLPVSLGRVHLMPYIDSEKIKIKYSTGDICNLGNDHGTRFWETTIEFTCDHNNLDSEPEFLGKDDCTYYFEWATPYACPPKPEEITDDCTVKDPNSGFLYNLTSLQDGLYQTEASHHRYYLNVCGNRTDNPCGPESGLCQEELTGKKRKWNGGLFNSRLAFNNGILFLNYSNGESCHSGHFQRNTIIEFHCGVGIGEPKFEHESHNCTYFFSWRTELACQTSMHCAIKNGSHYFDLSRLAQTYYTASSSIVNDDSLYYISVCGSLPHLHGANCPPGTAMCKVEKDENDPRLRSLSLGRLEYPPFVDFMGHATMLYTNGTTCDKNNALQNRARIIFLCDSEAGLGEPVLMEKDAEDCMYLFEWRTTLVCSEKPEDEGVMSCNYTDNSRGIHFDLSPLHRGSEPYKIANEKDGGQFLLQVCSSLRPSNVSNCETAGVCATGTNSSLNYGIASSQKFTYDGRRLRLTFYGGDDCPSGLNGKRTAEVFFVCDAAAGFGEPVLHKRYTCLIVFLWKTSLVCQNMQQQCSFDVEENHYDFNLLTSLSHNWNASDSQNTFWINLCRGVQQTPATYGCSPTAAICMMKRNDLHINLGTVHSMQAKAINSTDLMLTFESGDKRACTSVSSPTPLTPTTRIFMRCATTLGTPRIHVGPDRKCFYDFVWESSLACVNKAEQIMMEKDGIIKDPRFDFTVNITEILNRTFSVPGVSASDEYVYEINLSGGHQNTTEAQTQCSQAAVCQTKPKAKFYRDIGSFDTRTFIVRGTELHLTFISHTKPCGKNKSKNVTTLIKMQCVTAAGIGSPMFIYESGDCDYVFEWETVAVCPDFHRPKTDDESKGDNPNPDPYKEDAPSSHKAEIIVGVMVLVLILMVVGFIVAKPERRAHVSHRVRSAFGRVNLPYFRYKRGDILTELQSDF